MKQKPKRSADRQRTQTNNANKYDFLINLTDKIYALIDSGNFVGIIIVFFLFIILFILYKFPSENMNEHVRTIVALLTSEKFYIIPLSGLLLLSFSINIYQRKIYNSEIKRLSENRSYLMHGIEKGELAALLKHHNSGFNIDGA